MASWGSLASCCGLYRALGRGRGGMSLLSAARRSVRGRDTRVRDVHQFPSTEITTEKDARTFIVTLDETSRSLLHQEMINFENERLQVQNQGGRRSTMTRAELINVFLFHGIPFVGFGILDNLIMIVAGEYIDATLGAMLGISTMAAAGLGNLVSDVAGVGTAGYVEAWTSKIGVTVPVLSPDQASERSTRWAIALGRALGISVGCLIGMFPLLFFKGRKETDENSPEGGTTSPDSVKGPGGTASPDTASVRSTKPGGTTSPDTASVTPTT